MYLFYRTKEKLEKELQNKIEDIDIQKVKKKNLDDSSEYKIVLEINIANENEWYPVLKTINNNNIEIVKIINNYTTENQIVLNKQKK